MQPKVVAITLNWNGRDMTLDCVASLHKLHYDNYEIVVVDNGSTDGSVEALRDRFPNITLVENGRNLGYSEGFNSGIEKSMGMGAEYILILNNDTVIAPDALTELVTVAQTDETIGFVSGKVYHFDHPNILQTAGKISHPRSLVGPHIGASEVDTGQYDETKDFEFLDDVFLLVRREVIQKVGGYAKEFFLYYEETDWCARVRQSGFRIVFAPKARIWHKGSMSTGGGTNSVNTFWNSRNRYLFMYRNGTTQQWYYFLFTNWFYVLPVSILAKLSKGKIEIIYSLLVGNFSGLVWVIRNMNNN